MLDRARGGDREAIDQVLPLVFRFFAGLEIPEIAEALSISVATVKRDWRFARAWLARVLNDATLSELSDD